MSEPKDSPSQQWVTQMEIILDQVSSAPVVAAAGEGEKTSEPAAAKPDPDAALREAYPAALQAALEAHGLLTQPAIEVEALRIQTELIEAAKARAATGDHAGALALLSQVQAACLAAQAQAEQYAQALSGAEAELRRLDQPVSRKEAAQIQKDLITAAAQKVAADRAGAEALLGQVAAACAAAQRGADEYAAALRAAEAAVRLLVHPALVKDAEMIDSDFITAAKAKAAAGERPEAMALLDQVGPACEAARQEGLKYDQALQAANEAVALQTQPVVKNEVQHIKTTLIEAAKTQVSASGDRAAALALLAQVAGACASTKENADKYAAALRAAEAAVRLLVHPALVKDAEKIDSDFITAAKAKAATGERPEAMALLDQVGPACEAARQEGLKYDQALLAANEAVALLVLPVVKNEVQHIKTTLIEAAKTQVSATGDRAAALALLAQVAGACASAKEIADKYLAALQVAEVAAAALTHPVVAPEVALLKTETIEAAKTAAAAGDSGTAMTLLSQTGKRCQLAQVHTQRYVDGLALAVNRHSGVTIDCQAWSGWWVPHGGVLLGVADVIPDILASNINLAQTKAAAGEYLEAMALLEAVGGRINAVSKCKNEFAAFQNKWYSNDQLLSASYGTAIGFVIAAPAIVSKVMSIKNAVLDQGIATARLGTYVAALDALKTFEARYPEVQAMIVQHQSFEVQRAAALIRIDTLSHPDVAIDKAQMTTSRLTAADAKVVSGEYADALALLAKVDGECTAIAGYGAALTAAKAAVALLTDPAVSGDKARIQSERIDAAVALAAAWDYAGAMPLLAKVAAECDAAKAVVTGATEAAAAHGAAQAPIADVKTAPDPAFKAVEDMVAALDGLGDVIKDDRDAIRVTIALARAAVAKPEDGGDPKALLEQAANACLPARAVADRHAQYLLALADAELQLVALAEPLIAADKAKIELDRITKAKENIKAPARDYAGALAELAKVPADCAKAKAVVALDAAYQSALSAAKLKAATLTEALIAPDKLKIDTDLIAVAETKVTTRLYADAMGLLAQVAGACDAAKKVLVDEAAFQLRLTSVEALLVELNTQIGLVEAQFGPWPTQHAVAADIQLNHIDAAKARALLRDHAGAMALLASGEQQTRTKTQETTDFYWAGGSLYFAMQAITTLEGHGGAGAVAVEIAALKVRYQHGEDLRASYKYAGARQVGLEIQWACTAATKIAVLHDAYAPKLTAAKLRMSACTGLVNGLSPAVALIFDKLKDIQTRWLNAAEAQAKAREYAGATKLLDAVDAQCTAVETLVTQHGLYVSALAAAESELVPLTQPVVAGDVERIRRDRIEAARTSAAGLDYKTALDLLAKVKAECDTAAAVAAGNAAVAKGGADAKRLLDGTAEGVAAAWLEAEKLLKALTERHGARLAIKDLTDPIEQALALAKTLAPAEAGPGIEAVVDQCLAAQEAGDRHLEYDKALLAAQALVGGLTDPRSVSDKAKITLDRIDAAKAKALLHDFRGALALLEPVAGECATATALAGQFADYNLELAAAQLALDALNALTPVLDPLIGADVQKIKDECIEAAKVLALPATRDYAAARKLLARVAPRCKTAELKKSMLGGTDPTKGDIDAVLGMDGGKQLLDDVIASLPATTKRSVVQAALQARFNVELKNYTKDGALKPGTEAHPTTLKKLYELMAMVPDAHTDGIKIDRYGGKSFEKVNQDRGSFYQPGVAKVVLSCGRAKDGDPHPLANNLYALPDVEPDCELVPDSVTSPAPKYFDWTSLHELGHAIDDKKQFMAGKEGDAEFGGWRMHGRDVMPLALAAAAEFNFPASAYLAEYLLTKGGTPPVPDPLRLDWAACKAKAEAWCDAVRVDKQLWELGSETKKRAIGDRVYHEAYPGTWVSYNLSARSKGITGYQFRAPGEWLSELYAAHRMEKLKASHPANAWLATL